LHPWQAAHCKRITTSNYSKKAGILETERIGQTVLYKIVEDNRMRKVLGAFDEEVSDELSNHNHEEKI